MYLKKKEKENLYRRQSTNLSFCRFGFKMIWIFKNWQSRQLLKKNRLCEIKTSEIGEARKENFFHYQ